MEQFNLVPKKVFFTKGVGTHKDKLTSFELALRDAGIQKFNLVTVSSILPPNCEIITKSKGLPLLSDGEVVFVVMSRNESNEHNRLISLQTRHQEKILSLQKDILLHLHQ